MAKITINVGTTADDGTGDTLRGAFQNVNANFTELYSNVANTANLDLSQYYSANASFSTANLAYGIANLAYNKANSANLLAYQSNNYTLSVGAASNTWANTVGTAGNNYASVLVANTAAAINANAAYSYAAINAYSLVTEVAGNNYASVLVANTAAAINANAAYSYAAANNWANTKLANANRTINATGIVTYVLVAADAGKTIVANSTILVPNTVFYSGNVIHIYNNTATAITITPNNSVLITSAANSFGSRTLSANGYATLACIFGRDVGQNVFTMMGTTVT